jgi:hypothetical protein
MKFFVGIVIGSVFAAMSVAHGSELRVPSPPAKTSNCGDECYALHHPRARALKPLPCVPIRFVSKSGTVVVTLKYRNGTTFTDSKTVDGGVSQFCYGEFRFVELSRIELCDNDKNAWFDEKEVAGVRQRPKSEGIFMCLMGKDWCSTHKPGDT